MDREKRAEKLPEWWKIYNEIKKGNDIRVQRRRREKELSRKGHKSS
ncbi:MAG: hypothetical protein QW046_03970 [Candidatus Micrarchaeaceae archaeon]